VGWDHLRQGLRCFVLARMSEVTVNRRRPGSPDYTIPSGFTLKPYQNQQPWELAIHEPVRVSVEISEHRLPELLPQLNRAVPRGENRFDLEVTNRSGFVSWVLELKTDARVLAPVEIRNEIQRTLRNLL
jgi:predicted DNA-binding transcriptional regulator YafY